MINFSNKKKEITYNLLKNGIVYFSRKAYIFTKWVIYDNKILKNGLKIN